CTLLKSKTENPLNLDAVLIETARLYLKPISIDYKDEIFKNFTKEITKYLLSSPVNDISITINFINLSIKQRKKCTDLVLVILNKKTKEFLGICGLHTLHKKEQPDLGIWLKAAAHGHGFGKEAIHGLKQWTDNTLDYDYLIYPVDRQNIPSRKIPESMGGVIYKEEKIKTPDGRILDEVVYKIKKTNKINLKIQQVLPDHTKQWQTFLNLTFEYIKESWPSEIKNDPDKFKKEYEVSLKKRIADGGRGLFLFLFKDTVVGLGNVYLEKAPKGLTLNIAEFYIKPEARKQKLATKFFDLLKAWGKKNKAEFVYVEVDKDLKLANAFWSRQNLELTDKCDRNLYWVEL
ncbi:GNAT family N-acetyltransferase, partial [bacterium]|nr:GNAT family N-acetyltransferase [bacterium]